MSENDDSGGDIPVSLIPIFQRMHAEIQLLRYVVRFLCGATVPPDKLREFVEFLDVPIAGDTPETTKVLHDTVGRFLHELGEDLGVPKD